MRIIIFALIILQFSVIPLLHADNLKNDLTELDQLIRQKETFLQKKREKIQDLKKELEAARVRQQPRVTFAVYNQLYSEYKSFIYDSAFYYVNRMNEMARQMDHPDTLAEVQIKMGFTLLSSGLFKESLDILGNIRTENLNPETLKNFYKVIARTYYDLADYDNDEYFALKYKRIGNAYLDSALVLMDENTAAYWSAMGLRRMKANDYEGAADAFSFLLSRFSISEHEYAIATSSLGYIYTLLGRTEEATDLLIKAAVADIRSSTRETVALRNLAVLLFDRGDIARAYRYIKIALGDATFYNARHRKIEVGAVLPIIEGERLATVEKQKGLLMRYAYLITILSILVIIFFFIIYIQLKKLKVVRRILQKTNQDLQDINHHLMEANIIKEEYIGYFFNANSEYIEKMETFRKTVFRKVTSRQFDDLADMMRSSDVKKERENLFHNFDQIFLKLFPHFVDEFNSFFREEDRIVLKNDELLSPDLRIFALMRLGITDNEKIARFLNYSVNTIYTYKTKIRNKVQGRRELFEEKIMGSKTVRE